MDERIEKLALEAGLSYIMVPGNPYITEDLSKFAKFIVLECLAIVANADMTELEGPDPEDVLYVACKQIKEHFGVE